MATRRPQLYVWASRITKHLAGENQCAWADWFRAHLHNKLPQDADLAAWAAEHSEIVGSCSCTLTEDRYDVWREVQTSFNQFSWQSFFQTASRSCSTCTHSR